MGEVDSRPLLAGAAVAALGPITARTVASFGKEPEILPLENSIPGLLESIRRYFQRG
jgi:uroporphyrinogen-III synthase